MKLLRVMAVLMSVIASAASVRADANETVVLLHGLGRTSFSMARLAHDLKRDGYEVVNLTYTSRSQSLEEIATVWLPRQLATHAGAGKPRLHFVTHSMGGIVVRLWLSKCGAPANLGRVVMLAPPNAGSELSDRGQSFAPFRWATGKNGVRLTTAEDALPTALGAWPERGPGRELGIIAGDRSLNPWMARRLPLPNDGKVAVARTHLSGETDHITLPYSHTWLAWHARTITQVRAFLRDARFSRSE
jgi:alpha-beta hydrolase superfamily lysophospholipase